MEIALAVLADASGIIALLDESDRQHFNPIQPEAMDDLELLPSPK